MSEKKSQQDEGLLGDMTRHDAVMFLVNTALQLKQEGLPIRVTHKGNSIFFRIDGFEVQEDGTILERVIIASTS